MDKPSQALSKRIDHWILAITTFAIGCEFAWGVIWSVPNIALRLGLWPFEFDMGYRSLLPTLSFGQEALFFSGVALAGTALILLLKRSAIALPVFLIALLLDRADWIVMTLNPLEGSAFGGKIYRDMLFLSLQLVGLTGLILLLARRRLDRPDLWKRLFG